MRVASPGPATRTVVVVVCLAVLVGPGAPPSAAAGAGEAVDPGVDGVDRPPGGTAGVDAGGIGPAEGYEHGATLAPSAVGPPGEDIVETDQVVIVISMQPNGDARWRVEYRTELDDENTTDAFESLQSDIEQNPETYTAQFAERIGATVEDAENATGREMTAENFAVEARVTVDNDGVVAYTFDWSNFANDTAGGYRVGDAIAGFFLDADTRLEVQWPANWTLASVDPEPDSSPERAVIWRGASTDFGPEQPDLRFREGADRTATPTPTDTASPTPADDGDGGTTDGTGGDPADDSAGGDGRGANGLLVGALVAVVLVAAAVGVVYLRRPGAGPVGDSGGPVGDAVDDGGDRATGADASADAGGASGSDATDADRDDGEGDPEGEGQPIDEELLSNEERVLRLLEREGGRMKQQEVVEELGWTEAKTSQVVSGMREEGTVESFRLGRENVLTLPDEALDPTDDT